MDLLNIATTDRSRGNIKYQYLKAYVRNTYRILENRTLHTLEIGSVDVPRKYQRRGQFTIFLRLFEEVAHFHKFDAVYIECVHNEHLADFLLRCGYTLSDDLQPPNLYKMIRE